MKYERKDLFTTITGFLMAIADSVPGISGGTVAYILGKYDEFVISIASISGNSSKEEKRKARNFLIKLLIGWVIGLVLAISVIAGIVQTKPYELISLFLGFVILSIPYIIKQEGLLKHITIPHLLLSLVGVIAVVIITSFTSSAIDLTAQKSILNYVFIFGVGAIAISAMLIPGISGSTFMLIFGIYIPMVAALSQIMRFNFVNLDIVLAFGFGVLFGLFSFSKLVRFLLKHYRSKIVFFGVGLMIGSIYAIIMGPTTLADKVTKVNLGLDPVNFDNVKWIWLILGGVVIVSLEKLKNMIEGGKDDE